jgi:hypothetical protein
MAISPLQAIRQSAHPDLQAASQALRIVLIFSCLLTQKIKIGTPGRIAGDTTPGIRLSSAMAEL